MRLKKDPRVEVNKYPDCQKMENSTVIQNIIYSLNKTEANVFLNKAVPFCENNYYPINFFVSSLRV